MCVYIYIYYTASRQCSTITSCRSTFLARCARLFEAESTAASPLQLGIVYAWVMGFTATS